MCPEVAAGTGHNRREVAGTFRQLLRRTIPKPGWNLQEGAHVQDCGHPARPRVHVRVAGKPGGSVARL